MPVPCCVPPPRGCKFGSFRTHGGVEPPYATVKDHCEASVSYVSSLAMAVWKPHIAAYPNQLAYQQQECPSMRTKKNAWKLSARCHIVNRSACHNHGNLCYSSYCSGHRHGGCHGGCHCSVFVVMAVSMVPIMVIIIVVTAASLQGHGCQRSKKKCSLTVPVVTWRSFKKHWDILRRYKAMPPFISFFENKNYGPWHSNFKTQLCFKLHWTKSTS